MEQLMELGTVILFMEFHGAMRLIFVKSLRSKNGLKGGFLVHINILYLQRLNGNTLVVQEQRLHLTVDMI